MSWEAAQQWETDWWSDCLNTYGEEEKQLLYANRMVLTFFHDGKSPYNINLAGKSVLDIGGGPTSLLLKCHNRGRCAVVDPLPVPKWVRDRYALAKIPYHQLPAEEMTESGFDEAWIYNVLQHTRDPRAVVRNARRAGYIVRIFEWIDTPTNEGHPHSLTEAMLNEWLGGYGKVETLTGQANCFGRCYYGVFMGEQ